MSEKEIIRAWKDEDYRSGLSESELSALPENPAGLVELSGDEMKAAGGLWFDLDTATIITCMTYCYVCPIPGGGPDSPTLDYRCN